MFCSKKGVSPLIATVLLISFAVAIGAVVMNWAGSLAEGESCGEVAIGIAALCYDAETGQVMASVRNEGSDILGIRFLMQGSLGLTDVDIKKPLAEDDVKSFSAVYSTSESGTLQQITLEPLAGNHDRIDACSEKGVRTIDLPTC